MKMPRATPLPIRPRPAVSPVPTPDGAYAVWKAVADTITKAVLLACGDHRHQITNKPHLVDVALASVGVYSSRGRAFEKAVTAHVNAMLKAGVPTKAGGRYVVPRTEMPGEEVPESPVITKAGAPPANPFESTGGSTTSAPGRVIE